MKNKKQYNTLTDEQIKNMIEKMIRVSDFVVTDENIGELTDQFVDSFFDVYDEYELWGMSQNEALDFVSTVQSYTEEILEEYFEMSN